jgi:tRNA pseudouridine13 synthase
MSDRGFDDARPYKRARLEEPTETAALDQSIAPTFGTQLPTAPIVSGPATIDGDLARELRAGITEYVCPDNLGFAGVLKQRYTDFLVNEIGLDGKVLHLRLAGVEKKGGENGLVGAYEENQDGTKAKPKIDTEVENGAVEVAIQGDDMANARPAETPTAGVEDVGEEAKDEPKKDEQVGRSLYHVRPI